MATLQSLGTVRLRLRLGGDDYQETLHAVQGDTGRVLEFDVLDGNGAVVTDLAGVTPVLFVRRPDGKEVGSATGEIVGGVIRITIPSSLLAYAGEAKAQVQLVDSANQHKLHDHLYRLQIEESLEAGASPGENLWFSLAELTEAIEEVHLLVEQYDTDVAAVATMRDDVTSKHGEVTTMHSSLQSVFDSEQARRMAENARITAETDRQTAETERASAENARATAEDTRITNETTRQQAETQRDTDEDTRAANEAIRQSNEGVRESQEDTRETRESARQTLYEQLKALQEVLGTDPTVQVAQEVAELQTELKEIEDVVKAVQHEADNGADLIEEGGKLYRSKVEVIESVPTLTHSEVGFVVKDDIKTWTSNKTGTLYFKSQGQAEATILIYSLDESIKLAAKIDNRTMMYSAPVTTGELHFNTLNAAGQKVKIWDLEVR